MPQIEPGLLNCFYFFLLMLGVFYALLVMIAGGLHSIHLPLHVDLSHLPIHLPGPTDIHVGDVSSHDVSLLSLSPISIAAFITSFGGIGIIATQGFGVGGGASLVWAIGGSIVIAIISHLLFFYLFIAPQASSALKTSDVIGISAEVTAPIPGNSVGEIAYVAMGERHTATARSYDGNSIPRGALVTISGLAGTVMIVKARN
jgi:membrane protein implicated in regulation of membrane protease activity